MKKTTTIKDIADKAGVSVALVSFVMNNRTDDSGKKRYRVSDATAQRIKAIAKEMNYRPNVAARMLRNGKSLVVGTIIPNISNPYYGRIARVLENIAYEHGYTMLFGSSEERPEKMDSLIRSFIDRGVEGFIIVPCKNSLQSIRHVLDNGIPTVFLDRFTPRLPVPAVVSKDRDAVKKATAMLLDKGLKKIELISYKTRISSMTERESGFLEEMGRNGISPEDAHITRIDFGDTDRNINAVIDGILERKPEGLLFATNAISKASIKALIDRNVRIQHDIQLVGYGNAYLYHAFSPKIPYIQQPIGEICYQASEHLIKIMDNHQEQKYVKSEIDCTLVSFD